MKSKTKRGSLIPMQQVSQCTPTEPKYSMSRSVPNGIAAPFLQTRISFWNENRNAGQTNGRRSPPFFSLSRSSLLLDLQVAHELRCGLHSMIMRSKPNHKPHRQVETNGGTFTRRVSLETKSLTDRKARKLLSLFPSRVLGHHVEHTTVGTDSQFRTITN